MIIPDIDIRNQALNVNNSYIIEAPAGSGKTELLIQRFLTLLSKISSPPESVLVFTFTRKSAKEIKKRIFDSLYFSHINLDEPKEKHKRKTWCLAKIVLEKSNQKKWNILSCLSRLNITTIDSFCLKLISKFSLRNYINTDTKISENPDFLYKKAINLLLDDLENPKCKWHKNLLVIFKYFDNRFDILNILFMKLLSKREEWIEIIGIVKKFKFEYLDKNLKFISQNFIFQIYKLIPKNIIQKLKTLMSYSQNYLDIDLPLDLSNHNNISSWKNFSNWILNKKGEWRKVFNKNQGFPTFTKKTDKYLSEKMKYNIKKVISILKNIYGLKKYLNFLQIIPVQGYSSDEKKFLQALCSCLPILIAYLNIVFSKYKKIDFNEVILSALVILNSEKKLTDIMINVDNKIQHLLVDEFQDISEVQFRLLYSLIQGWNIDDGRTVFFVGDPMQSIYRFRKAEVDLFIQMTKGKFFNISLIYLKLSANFRSQSDIVEWNNQVFQNIFPLSIDNFQGSISFNPSIPMKFGKKGLNIYLSDSDSLLKEKMVKILNLEIKKNPNIHIAILLRSKKYYLNIASILNKHNILFQSIDLESMRDYSIIQDLLLITYSIINLADKLSWVSFLRSPLCGFLLQDIHFLSIFSNSSKTIWEILQEKKIINKLSSDGKIRTKWFIHKMKNHIKNIGRLRIDDLIWKIWIELDGPKFLSSIQEDQVVDMFFDFIKDQKICDYDLDKERFESNLFSLKIPVISKKTNIEIMTIHKAKGLEFDCVILPECQKIVSKEHKSFLLWHQYRYNLHKSKIIMAPIQKTNIDKKNSLYFFLKYIENKKNYYEIQRLFYVASTRAQYKLIYLGKVKKNNNIFSFPYKESFLYLIWPMIRHNLNDFFLQKKYTTQNSISDIKKIINIKRRKINTCFINNIIQKKKSFVFIENTSYEQEMRILFRLGLNMMIKKYFSFKEIKSIIYYEFHKISYFNKKIFQKIISILKQITYENDKEIKWILKLHPIELTEYKLIEEKNGKIKKWIIDRCFIDKYGRGWIFYYVPSIPQKSQSFNSFKIFQLQYHKKNIYSYEKIISYHFPKVENWNKILYFFSLPKIYKNFRFFKV